MTTISPKVTPYYGGGQVTNPADVIQSNVNPSSANIQHNLGTLAVNYAQNKVFCLAGKSGGVANWVELGGGTDTFPITPYVVGPVGQGGYQTIQSAVTAAGAAGGGIVYIQPGTYTENVTMGVGVDLVAFVGTSGNTGLGIPGGEEPSVKIIGNFTLDVTAATSVPTTEIKNIQLSANSGTVFTYLGNVALLESGYLTFEGCHLQTGTGATRLFHMDGFFNMNLVQCVVDEETPNSTTFINFGATPFLNLNSRNSYIDINKVNACILPNSSYVTFALENTAYSMRVDLSGGSSSFFCTAFNCFISFNGASPGDPLFVFGANDGSVVAQNCVVTQASGSFANSTTISAASNFFYYSCVFNNPLVIGATGRGNFSFCEFIGGTDPAITMSSSQDISLIDCTVSSSNNPAIAGSGAGTLSIGNVVFTDNAAISGTLTLAWLATKTGPFTVAGDITSASGNIIINGAAKQLQNHGGAATDFIGQATLVNGVATILNTNISTSDRILVTRSAKNASTAYGSFQVVKTASTNFVITSCKADTTTETGDQSTVDYFIVRQV